METTTRAIEQAPGDGTTRRAAAIVAHDLIWGSRITAAVERAGLRPIQVRDADGVASLARAEPVLAGLIVDLGTSGEGALAAVAAGRDAGLTVLVIAQHEDAASRRRAMAAGALRVLSYRVFFEQGPRLVERWLEMDQSAVERVQGDASGDGR